MGNPFRRQHRRPPTAQPQEPASEPTPASPPDLPRPSPSSAAPPTPRPRPLDLGPPNRPSLEDRQSPHPSPQRTLTPARPERPPPRPRWLRWLRIGSRYS